jgi:hypothetical protein
MMTKLLGLQWKTIHSFGRVKSKLLDLVQWIPKKDHLRETSKNLMLLLETEVICPFSTPVRHSHSFLASCG